MRHPRAAALATGALTSLPCYGLVARAKGDHAPEKLDVVMGSEHGRHVEGDKAAARRTTLVNEHAIRRGIAIIGDLLDDRSR